MHATAHGNDKILVRFHSMLFPEATTKSRSVSSHVGGDVLPQVVVWEFCVFHDVDKDSNASLIHCCVDDFKIAIASR